MEVRARAARATASGLILALAVGVAGTTGISTALAVDSPTTVALSGSLRDGTGSPLAGTATAKPDAARPAAAPTPPPTDAGVALEPERSDRQAIALLIGFATGLLATLLFVLPRPRRRRD